MKALLVLLFLVGSVSWAQSDDASSTQAGSTDAQQCLSKECLKNQASCPIYNKDPLTVENMADHIFGATKPTQPDSDNTNGVQ